MDIKLFISTAVLCFTSLFVVHPLYASGISTDLGLLDAFHPPIAGDERSLQYKEWHYFTLTDERENITFNTVFSLEGDVSDPSKSYALKLQNYGTKFQSDNTLDAVPIELARWSDKSPDVNVDQSSISYDGKKYRVHTESLDGKVIFDAVWHPEIKPEAVIKLPVESSGDYMNWLLTAAEMRVNGTLVINKGMATEKTFQFKNAKGYHDHNWGYWDWSDDFGWNWGQVISRDEEKYTLALLNMTDSHGIASEATFLKVWKNKNKVKTFESFDVKIRHKMMDVPYLPNYKIPKVNHIVASSGFDKLNIIFTTKQYFPVYLPIDGGYRIIWELTGTFEVNGRLNGKAVQFVADGSMEYFGEPLFDQ